MSDQSSKPAGGDTASTGSAQNSGHGAASSSAAPKRPAAEGNPAFRMMGLPRFRLPSRNWMIFLGVTGSFASAVLYDKWQTRRAKDKWCQAVAHIADEPLSTRSMPRRLTIYLAAPPADGLRSAREHFHEYVKPILVAAALDWDVVEGRKEGDVRYKTAQRIRRKRKRAGEGAPEPADEATQELTVEALRAKSGTTEYDGVAGDIVIGRHTWKEYVRGLHEGFLGPVDAPTEPEPEADAARLQPNDSPGHSSLGDAAVKGVANVVADHTLSNETAPQDEHTDNQPSDENPPEDNKEDKKEDKKEEEEKPKRRNPAPYISTADYEHATLSPSAPDVIGPSTAVRFPHLLGIRNTPIRIYRFLTRRRLADDIGRQVASAVLASQYRPYDATIVADENSAGGAEKVVPEQVQVLKHEERDWWKTVRDPRKEHEESVWIEDMVLDERLAGRMNKFELSAEDDERAKRIAEGVHKAGGRDNEN